MNRISLPKYVTLGNDPVQEIPIEFFRKPIRTETLYHSKTPNRMTEQRENAIAIKKEEFQKLGYQLIDNIANFIDTIEERPVTTTKTPS